MANDFITSDFILRSVLFKIEEKLASMAFFKNAPSLYHSNPEGWLPGNEVHVPRTNSFKVRDGVAMEAQDTTEGKLSVTLDKRSGVDVKISMQELTIDKTPENFKKQIIDPAQTRLAAYIDEKAFKSGVSECPNMVNMRTGDKANIVFDIIAAHTWMDAMSISEEGRILFVSPTVHEHLLQFLTEVKSDDLVKFTIEEGKVKSISGSKVKKTPNLPYVTSVKSPTQFQIRFDHPPAWGDVKDSYEFDVSFVCKANSGETDEIPAGTIFTIDGTRSVNPLTHTIQQKPRCFKLLKTIGPIGSTASTFDVSITPPPLMLPPDADKAHVNITSFNSGTPTNCTILNQPTGDENESIQPVMFLAHEDAMICPQSKLMLPKDVPGHHSSKADLLLRIVSQFKIDNDEQFHRIDHFCGARLLEQDAAVVIPCVY